MRKDMTMLTKLVIMAALAVLLAVSTVSAQALQVKITRLAGAVEVRPGGGNWAPARMNQMLTGGQSLRTLRSGRVQLLFPNNTIVLIKENSLLNLKELSQGGGAKLKALAGGFVFNLKQALSPGSTFEVQTPAALAVVRGTVFGMNVLLDGTTSVYGFEDTVEVIAGGKTVTLGAGEESDTRPGEAAGDPHPSSVTQDSMEQESSISDAESAAGEPGGQAFDQMDSYLAQLDRLAQEVDKYYSEFQRYLSIDDQARMSTVYNELMRINEELAAVAAEIQGLMNNNPTLDFSRGRDPINAEIDDTQNKINDMIDRVKAFAQNIDSLTDNFLGLIPQDNPTLTMRPETIDTDGDGIPDIIEIALGTDPLEDGLVHGFFHLLAPPDGQVFTFPDVQSADFSFEPLQSDLIEKYEFVIKQAGAEVFRDTMPGTAYHFDLTRLLSGMSASKVGSESGSEYTWYVDATLGGRAGSRLSGKKINSESRTFTLAISSDTGFVELLIDPASQTAHVGDRVRVKVKALGLRNLKTLNLVVTYDHTVLSFYSGNKSGLFLPSTLFFSNTRPDEVSVSGERARDAGPITGDGYICELEFIAEASGMCNFDIQNVRLVNDANLDIPYSTTPGDVQVLQGSGPPAA
jgi:hypothetical protein